MGTEIERKYRLANGDWRTPEVLASGKPILQGYFTTKGGTAARLEADGGKRLIIERREDGTKLPDVVVPLSDASFTKLSGDATDGRLSLSSGFEARARLKGGKGTVTMKSGKGLSRVEIETSVDSAVADALLSGPQAAIVGALIEKVRYQADLGNGLVAEIDVYSGMNHGLEVVEVELPSEYAEVPQTSWIGEDVTNGDLGNAELALHPWTTRTAASRAEDTRGI